MSLGPIFGTLRHNYYIYTPIKKSRVSFAQIFLAFLGTIPITVKCQKESDKSIVSDSSCLSDDKPSASKSCYAGECPVAYIWKISWGFCSVTCGKGKESTYSLSTMTIVF